MQAKNKAISSGNEFAFVSRVSFFIQREHVQLITLIDVKNTFTFT